MLQGLWKLCVQTEALFTTETFLDVHQQLYPLCHLVQIYHKQYHQFQPIKNFSPSYELHDSRLRPAPVCVCGIALTQEGNGVCVHPAMMLDVLQAWTPTPATFPGGLTSLALILCQVTGVSRYVTWRRSYLTPLVSLILKSHIWCHTHTHRLRQHHPLEMKKKKKKRKVCVWVISTKRKSAILNLNDLHISYLERE